MKLGLYMATQWRQGANLGPELANLIAQVRTAKASGPACGTPKGTVASTASQTPAVAPSANAGTEGADTEKRQFTPGEDRRKSRVDRRSGLERRQMSREEANYNGPERRSGEDRRVATGLERRRGPGRRRNDDRREAEEGEMNTEQAEVIRRAFVEPPQVTVKGGG